MFESSFEEIKNRVMEWIYQQIISWLEIYLPKFIWALVILWLWILVSFIIYKVVIYIFEKFKIIKLIDKFFTSLSNNVTQETNTKENNTKEKTKKISDKIKIDKITAKAFSYYIFLVFFRLAIVFIWIKEVENFLWELIAYLPSLFIAIIIWFFWVRFANFVYGLVFHALDLTKQKTAKIIASWAKIIILFFTLMVVLSKIWIATEITNTILIWFVSMLAIAWWLAFWLWWKDIAHEILESFRK